MNMGISSQTSFFFFRNVGRIRTVPCVGSGSGWVIVVAEMLEVFMRTLLVPFCFTNGCHVREITRFGHGTANPFLSLRSC